MEEEKIEFQTSKSVFYNTKMRLCRSISSLALGAITDPIEVVDAFCATGIRGIRYAKENPNVKKITFVDLDKKAITLARKNAKKNKLKSSFEAKNISHAAFDLFADFLEIDPFGTPSPYLLDSMRFFNRNKVAYLSVTATDVAVLCGGIVAACMKNYHSKPLNNEFTHENGLRIMIKRIAEVAAEFNFGVCPLISFSNKHYLKSVIRLDRSADLAYSAMRSLGYVSYCSNCGYRSSSKFPQSNCSCGNSTMDYAGSLWLGELHNRTFLEKMISLNQKRDYSDRDEIDKMLNELGGEIALPAYYYNVHNLSKFKKSTRVMKITDVIDRLRTSGFIASRTHFSPISIKTNAPYSELLKVI
ncbi:tRNA (guanine(10)-N(2))-dimethyltransferase [Candidatus Micrarchaeota archaeon]|nr:tRNA (guanine(10)-N(2))-dimethyltransferase [Candidatus Micrarchaeota archaeon]